VPGDDLGHPVVGHAGQLGRLVRAAQRFDRRSGKAQDLAVVAELIHDSEACVEVDDHRDFAHPLLHECAAGRDPRHAVVKGRGQDVAEDVDFHRRI
jgi:hypothetical protein